MPRPGPLVWRVPEGPEGTGGFEATRKVAHQRPGPLVWRASEGLEGLAAVLVGGGGAWPDNESTRRVKLAARTTRGRAAAHGHTKQPGPTRQRVERSAKAEWSGGTCLELTSSWAIRQQEPLLIEALWMLSNRALDKCCVMRH